MIRVTITEVPVLHLILRTETIFLTRTEPATCRKILLSLLKTKDE